MKLEKEMRAAQQAAKAAERILLRHRKRRLTRTAKLQRDFVTNADLASERVILATLRRRFPDHAVYAEESGLTAPEGREAMPAAADLLAREWLWVVDPLDGTINYAHGLDHFNVTIALVHRGARVLGIVRSPVLGETYLATRDGGATRNGRPLRVRERPLDEALFISYVSAHYSRPQTTRAMRMVRELVLRSHGWRDFGNGAADLCQVARGSVDFLVTTKCDAWSFSAAALVVEEAGGVVTDLAGDRWTLGSKSLLAGPRKLVNEVRAIATRALRG